MKSLKDLFIENFNLFDLLFVQTINLHFVDSIWADAEMCEGLCYIR